MLKTEVKEVVVVHQYCPECGYEFTDDTDFCPCCDNTQIGLIDK